MSSKTAAALSELVNLTVNPMGKRPSELAMSPGGTGGKLFVLEGGQSLTIDSNITNAVVTFDDIATLRHNELAAVVYQKDASNVVKKVTKIGLARPSNEFKAGAVLSSTLQIKNQSAQLDISGTSSQAIVYSVPDKVASITSTDLMHLTDAASQVLNIDQREDSTLTTTIAPDDGLFKAPLKKGCSAQPSSFLAYVSNGVATAANGFPASATTVTNTAVGSTALGSDMASQVGLFDSRDFTTAEATNNPCTLSTYQVKVDSILGLGATGAVGVGTYINFVVCGLDAAGFVVARKQIDVEVPVALSNGAASQMTAQLTATLISEDVPIADIMITSNAASSLVRGSGQESSMQLEAIEETGTVAGRGIHIAVLQGLNSNAVLNFRAGSVLDAVVSSENSQFVQSSGYVPGVSRTALRDGFDEWKAACPKAYTASGAGVAEAAMAGYFNEAGTGAALEARSYGAPFHRAIGTARRMAKALPFQARSFFDQAKNIGMGIVRRTPQYRAAKLIGTGVSELTGMENPMDAVDNF
jgi:hypothetical protein